MIPIKFKNKRKIVRLYEKYVILHAINKFPVSLTKFKDTLWK